VFKIFVSCELGKSHTFQSLGGSDKRKFLGTLLFVNYIFSNNHNLIGTMSLSSIINHSLMCQSMSYGIFDMHICSAQHTTFVTVQHTELHVFIHNTFLIQNNILITIA